MEKLIFLIIIFSVSSFINHLNDEKRRKKHFQTPKKKATVSSLDEVAQGGAYVPIEATETIEAVPFEAYEVPHEVVHTYDEALLEHKEAPERAIRKKAIEGNPTSETKGIVKRKVKKSVLKPIGLKDAYIWKEILDKPVSMRKDA